MLHSVTEFNSRSCGRAARYINSQGSGLSSTNWGRDHLCIKSNFSQVLSCFVHVSIGCAIKTIKNSKRISVHDRMKKKRSYLKIFVMEIDDEARSPLFHPSFEGILHISLIRIFLQSSLPCKQCNAIITTMKNLDRRMRTQFCLISIDKF